MLFAEWNQLTFSWQERVAVAPDILVGKLIVRGTRLSVEFIMDLLIEAWSEEEVLRNYPRLSSEDIKACLAYARELG